MMMSITLLLLFLQMLNYLILATSSNDQNLNSHLIKEKFNAISWDYKKNNKTQVGILASALSLQANINSNTQEFPFTTIDEVDQIDDLRNNVYDLIKRLEKIERDSILKVNINNDILLIENKIIDLYKKIDSKTDKETKYLSDLEALSFILNKIQISLESFKKESKSEIDIIRENLSEAFNQINLNKIQLMKQNNKNIYYYSRQYGGSGGDSIYRDPIPGNPSMTVRKVFVRYGWYLDMIQLLVGDDATNTYYKTDFYGRTKSQYGEWSVPKGEFITKIEVYVRRDAYVSSIFLIGGVKFITDKGSKSPLYGGSAGDLNVVNLPGYLVGLAGRYGSSMDAIQFISTMHLN